MIIDILGLQNPEPGFHSPKPKPPFCKTALLFPLEKRLKRMKAELCTKGQVDLQQSLHVASVLARRLLICFRGLL